MAERPAYLAGDESLRAPHERRNRTLCLIATPFTLVLASRLFGSIGPAEIALLVVGALVFVSFARGRLLGGSVRLGDRQLPEIARATAELAAALGIAAPHVFVRDDSFVPISAVGTHEPYSLVLSSQYLEHLEPAEVRFLIARELAHLAAGHTRLTSLLSASGRENPAVALVFGAWLRRTEYTADRIALALAPDLPEALRAIAVASYHAVGRRVDLERLFEQQRELDDEPALRLGEWSSSQPYATRRFLAARAFTETPLFATWRDRFAERLASPAIEPAATEDAEEREAVGRERYAPIGARLGSIAVDFVAVVALANLTKFTGITQIRGSADAGDPPVVVWLLAHGGLVARATATFDVVLLFVIAGAVLVGLTGQTLGMMVFDLRVVTTRSERPAVLRVVWRYLVGWIALLSGAALVGLWLRVHPHDRLSGTRVIRTRSLSPAPPVRQPS